MNSINKHSILIGFFAALLLAGLSFLPVSADDAQPTGSAEPYFGQVLCLPGAQLGAQSDCLALGPSQVLTSLAKRGIEYPFKPLPATRPDPSLNNAGIYIAKINIPKDEQAKIYSSLEDAANGANPSGYLEAGRNIYVSYIQQADVNGGHYLLLKDGGWVRASPLAASASYFQGLLFHENPTTPFGWIVEPVITRSAPSYAAPEDGRALARENAVQIFDMVDDGTTKWYMVGLNEWVERRYIREFQFNPNPPQGVTNNRWIDVNLYEQTIGVYENGRLLFATLIASGGDPYFTRPGLFQIYEKKPTEHMSGAFEADRSDYYLFQDVPWTMYFDEARALHGAYWRANFGYPETHGCVNLSLGDANWLFHWANEGDWVYVHDPSGLTPTDPSLYTAGGA